MAEALKEVLYGEFEYAVRLNVSIPLEWANALKLVAASHYDYKCKESGNSGIINGLFNCAKWNSDEPGSPSFMPVSWSDCDLMTKVMEQAHYIHDASVVALQIGVWLRTMKERLEARHKEIRLVHPNELTPIQEETPRSEHDPSAHGGRYVEPTR